MITLNVRRSFETFAAGDALTLPDQSARALARAYPGIFEYAPGGSSDTGSALPDVGDDAPLPIPARDYGYIRYGEMMGATTVAMAANTDTPFVVRAPRTLSDKLKGRFAGFAFFDDQNILRCQQPGDSYFLSLRMTITPQVVGGWFELDIVVNGNVAGLPGPTSSRQVPLTGPAGSGYRFDQLLQVFPSTGFAANGANIVMRSSVPVTLSNDVLFITPVVAAS